MKCRSILKLAFHRLNLSLKLSTAPPNCHNWPETIIIIQKKKTFQHSRSVTMTEHVHSFWLCYFGLNQIRIPTVDLCDPPGIVIHFRSFSLPPFGVRTFRRTSFVSCPRSISSFLLPRKFDCCPFSEKEGLLFPHRSLFRCIVHVRLPTAFRILVFYRQFINISDWVSPYFFSLFCFFLFFGGWI